LYQSDVLYPNTAELRGPENAAARRRWVDQADFQILKNPHALPRAWVVHAARAIPTQAGGDREDRRRFLGEIAYGDDIWHEARLKVFDPRSIAWLPRNALDELAPFVSSRSERAEEYVLVSYPTPQRAELDVTLRSPGLVILSDLFYPGWELNIDGKPAPIYRVNQMMRGAAVTTGSHKLIYSYHPRSFRIGCIISGLGAVAMVVFAAICVIKPVDARVAA
jgi:hypothetical protein